MNADAARDAIAEALYDTKMRGRLASLPPRVQAFLRGRADEVIVALQALPDAEFQRIRQPGYTQPSPNCPACTHPWAEHYDVGCARVFDDGDPCVCRARPPR